MFSCYYYTYKNPFQKPTHLNLRNKINEQGEKKRNQKHTLNYREQTEGKSGVRGWVK